MNTELPLNLSGIVWESVVDGPGLRAVFFAQGCRHGCLGCFNADLQPFRPAQAIAACDIIQSLAQRTYLDGITLSGGDPLEQAEAFLPIAAWCHEQNLSVWAYTGYTWDEVQMESTFTRLLPYIDVLVDGKFEQSLADMSLLFRGSTNQRLIDVRSSLIRGHIVLWQAKAEKQ